MGVRSRRFVSVALAVWGVGASIGVAFLFQRTQEQSHQLRADRRAVLRLAAAIPATPSEPMASTADLASVGADIAALRAELRGWERQATQAASNSDSTTTWYVNNQIAQIQSQIDGLTTKLDFTIKQAGAVCAATERAGLYGFGNGCG